MINVQDYTFDVGCYPCDAYGDNVRETIHMRQQLGWEHYDSSSFTRDEKPYIYLFFRRHNNYKGKEANGARTRKTQE